MGVVFRLVVFNCNVGQCFPFQLNMPLGISVAQLVKSLLPKFVRYQTLNSTVYINTIIFLDKPQSTIIPQGFKMPSEYPWNGRINMDALETLTDCIETRLYLASILRKLS